MNTNYINNNEMSARDKILAMLGDDDFVYKRGNIVWINVPEELKGVTHIQSGMRRGLIFSNDVNNLFSDLIYIIPCSRRRKKMKFHIKHENQYIFAEQLNPIDKSWIMTDKEIVQIDEETMKTVEDSFLKQFGMKELMVS